MSSSEGLQPAQSSFPTPDELRQAAEVIQRWIETRRDDTSQEATMARYTADNLLMTALALEHTEP